MKSDRAPVPSKGCNEFEFQEVQLLSGQCSDGLQPTSVALVTNSFLLLVSKAPVTTSVALVTNSFLLLVSKAPVTTSVALVTNSFLVTSE